jgi:hypothetical protein
VAITLSALSTVYICEPFYVTQQGKPYDPTADAVQFAFQPAGSPPSAGDWVAGAWWPAQQADGGWVAQILIGPAAATSLVPGSYAIWAKVAGNPEVPVGVCGRLEIVP